MTDIRTERVQFAVREIASEVERRFHPIPMDETDMWHEFDRCVLSSQVSYEVACLFARKLHDNGAGETHHAGAGDLETQIQGVLLTPAMNNQRPIRYRFPKSKASQLARARTVIRASHGSITSMLDAMEHTACREWMVKHVPGVGPKQASMFLRNVAGALDLAVLDRHVLRYMAMAELEEFEIPQTVQNLPVYFARERVLQQHADSLGFRVGILDWAIWIVMRASAQVA
jgi:N-glycosylase/DNA lyase